MPDWKPEIRQRLAGLQLAPTREAAVVEELAQHLDDYYAELLASGALSMREIVMTSSLRHRHKQTLAIAALLCAMASAWLFYGHKATAQTQTSNAPSQPSSARKAGEVVITRAELTGPNGEKLPYELGTVFVPENRSNPRSRLIGVAFARFRAANAAAGALPVFHLPGGPGESAVDGLTMPPPWPTRMAQEVLLFRQAGDVVFVDQRGYSKHGGNVLEYFYRRAERPLDQPTTLELARRDWIENSERALAEARSRGVDLAGYTILELADDVNDLRKALGYNRITLYGNSFGSQWSFAVMKRHPKIVARALVSAVAPLDYSYDGPTGVMNALARMADAEEREDATLKSSATDLPVGGLMAAIRLVIERLKQGPVVASVNSEKGDSIRVALGLEDFRQMLPRLRRGAIASTSLPIYRGDYSAWAQTVYRARQPLPDRVIMIQPLIMGGLGSTAERLARLKTDPATLYLGEWGWAAYLATAHLRPTPDVGDDFRRPAKSAIPVIFAQGDWDLNTPVENTLEIAPYFPNGKVLIAHRGGHGVVWPIAQQRPDIARELMKFLRTGDLNGIPAEVTLR